MVDHLRAFASRNLPSIFWVLPERRIYAFLREKYRNVIMIEISSSSRPKKPVTGNASLKNKIKR